VTSGTRQPAEKLASSEDIQLVIVANVILNLQVCFASVVGDATCVNVFERHLGDPRVVFGDFDPTCCLLLYTIRIRMLSLMLKNSPEL
jgi:hypothetical protein